MSDSVFEIEIHNMRIGGLGVRHVVAKVGRISSPPVAVDTVPDPRASAIARLADVIRAEESTRAHADYIRYKRTMREEPYAEWEAYVAAVCRALGCEQLEPLTLSTLPAAAGGGPVRVTYHEAQMNDKPYVVSRIGPILGGPAAIILLDDPAHSALERLADVLRAGSGGRCFADLLVGGSAAESASEWQQYGRAVAEEVSARNGVGAAKDEWITDPQFNVGELYRYTGPSGADMIGIHGTLAEGDVVRVLTKLCCSPSGRSVVEVGDRETGVRLGLVSSEHLRPL